MNRAFSRALLASVFLSLISPAVFAQTGRFEIVGWATYIDPSGDDQTDEYSLSFDSSNGPGIGLNVLLSQRFSVQLAASAVKPDANFSFSNTAIPIARSGELRIIPLSALLQFHLLGGSRLDPYIGGGVGYLLVDQLKNVEGLSDVDVGAIDFKDDYAFVANAGLNLRVTRRFFLNADVKYLPVDLENTVTFVRGDFVEKQKLAFDPLIVSLGLGFRF